MNLFTIIKIIKNSPSMMVLLCIFIIFIIFICILSLILFVQNITNKIKNKKIFYGVITIISLSIIILFNMFVKNNIMILLEGVFEELLFFQFLSFFYYDLKDIKLKPKLNKFLLSLFFVKFFIFTIPNEIFKQLSYTFCNTYYLGIKLSVYLIFFITLIILNYILFSYWFNLINKVIIEKNIDSKNRDENLINKIDHNYFISKVFQFRVLIINYYLIFWINIFKISFYFYLSFNTFYESDCNMNYYRSPRGYEVVFYSIENNIFSKFKFYEFIFLEFFKIVIPCLLILRIMKNEIFIKKFSRLDTHTKNSSEIKFNFVQGLYLIN